jgi:hypothetical protein
MRFDSIQVWTLIAPFVVPVLIGASCKEFVKAVAIAASAAFLGNLLYANLFGGWDGFGGLERNMLEAAGSVPLSVPLAAAGFGLRRLWTQLMTGHRPV